ncbi:MAG: PTS system mannose/fructose/N-acetylgalactosamine-transporter subunit IIB [Anaerorhabdus sp.]
MDQFKMDNGIVDVRVDDRMIHGVVATEWIPSERATRAMVINEDASKSDMLRSTLKMATPGGTALSVLAPSDAVENFKINKYSQQRVFVVARHISDIYDLFKGGVEFKRVNLGNVTQNMDSNLLVLDKTVRVTERERLMLKEIQDSGVQITCQFRTSDAIKDCKNLL